MSISFNFLAKYNEFCDGFINEMIRFFAEK